VTDLLRKLWSALREVSGDDAYERYLAHWSERHAASGGAPLDRAAFFAEEQRRKWSGVSRCC
jgi:uncharacterized short protein YbdD (DUF466 family)